eukprot:2629744-Pyramimonas_sp.AAC.1
MLKLWAYEGLRWDLLASLGDHEGDTPGVRAYLQDHKSVGLQDSVQIRVHTQHCRIQMPIQQEKIMVDSQCLPSTVITQDGVVGSA